MPQPTRDFADPNPAPRRIGLTGSIGSGKSTVGRLLSARGYIVLDADAVARQVSADPDALEAVTAQLGPEFVQDGALNRPLLAQRVFADPSALERLNAILHPRVRARMAQLERDSGAAVVFQDIPLLFENGLERQFEAVLVVDAPAELRRERVQSRSGLSAEQFRARDRAQLAPAEKRARATYLLENDGDLTALEAQLEAVLRALGLAPGTPPDDS